MIEPRDLWAWSWVPVWQDKPEWSAGFSVLTQRAFEGEMVEVRTKMGRRVKVHRLIIRSSSATEGRRDPDQGRPRQTLTGDGLAAARAATPSPDFEPERIPDWVP